MGKGRVKYALQLAGNQHRYQIILTVLICMLWIIINYIMIGPSLIYMDPVFHCKSTGQQRIQQQQACQMINQCSLIDDFTLTSKLKLYCQSQWVRDTIQSIFSIGSFLGLVIMNLISDTKGRKISTMIALGIIFLSIICTLLGGYFQLITLLIFAQFAAGFGSYASVTLSYILLSDFCSDTLRPKAVVIINSAWGFSTISLGIYYLQQVSWQYFVMLYVLIPFIIMAIAKYFYILESPYILVNQNKKQKALQVLIQIAKINKRQQNIQKIQQIIKAQEQRTAQNQASFKNVLKEVKQWKYLKEIILITTVYAIGNLNFYSVQYAFELQGFGFGINSLIGGTVQISSFIYLTWFVNRIPRRKGIMLFYGICAFIGLTFLFGSIKNNKILQTSLLGTMTVFRTIAYTLVACVQVQAFPVEIQSTAAGLIQAFSLIGVFFAPLLVDLSDKIGIDPIALVSIFLIGTFIPTYFMKETLIQENRTNPEQEYKQSLISSHDDNQYYINSSSQKSLPTNDSQQCIGQAN